MWWSSMQGVDVVESSCFPTHNIAPHISLHDQPCHKTMKKYEDFERMVISLPPRRNSRFEHGSVIVHNIFAYFALSLSASQVYVIQERCWFSQIYSLLSTFHIGSRFCFFPANFMSSTYTDKNNPFQDEQRDMPNLEFSPSHASIGFSQLPFP